MLRAECVGRCNSLTPHGWKCEWQVICQDLEALSEVEVREEDQWYLICCGLPYRESQGRCSRLLG